MTKRQRTFSGFFTLLVAGLMLMAPVASQAAESGQLIAILSADTTEAKVGRQVARDYANIRQEIQRIAEYTNLNLKEVNLVGRAVTRANMLKALKGIQVRPNDVVIFFHTGHGFRDQQKQTDWPYLYFSVNQSYLDYQEVIDLLAVKNPRLLVTMVSSCNNELTANFSPIIYPQQANATVIDRQLVVQNYQALFLQTSGQVLITSSKPGESSYTGVYPLAFLKSMNQEVTLQSIPSWDHLLEATSLQSVLWTQKIGQKQGYNVQHIHYELNVE